MRRKSEHEVRLGVADHLPLIRVGRAAEAAGDARGERRVVIADRNDRMLRQAGKVKGYMPMAHAEQCDFDMFHIHSSNPPIQMTASNPSSRSELDLP